MSRLRRVAVICLAMTMPALPTLAADPPAGSIEVRTAEGPKTVTPDWRKINAQPLGGKGNPVRADGLVGERAYMERLRCGNGTVIYELRRLGPAGIGPYTTPVSAWEVECYGELYVIHLDAAHPKHVERRPARGFMIRDP